MIKHTLRFFKRLGFFAGLSAVVALTSVIGSLFLKEVKSFVAPAAAPAAGGGLSADTGIVGDPALLGVSNFV